MFSVFRVLLHIVFVFGGGIRDCGFRVCVCYCVLILWYVAISVKLS